MRILTLALLLTISCTHASAQGTDSGKTLNEAERARVKSQVDALQRAKLQGAEQSGKAVKEAATRQAQAVDKQHEQARHYVDKTAEQWSYVVGPQAAKSAAEARQRSLAQEAQSQKDKINRAANEKAATQKAAAQKYANNVNQSVEGLKSQVSKGGKYGLQPKGSNLYVRQYGK